MRESLHATQPKKWFTRCELPIAAAMANGLPSRQGLDGPERHHHLGEPLDLQLLQMMCDGT
jgi:hypothetical protein